MFAPQSIQLGFDPVKALQQFFHVRPELRPSDVISGNLFPRAVQKNLNALDELFEIIGSVEEKLKNLHPSILYDMQKYYPEAWAVM